MNKIDYIKVEKIKFYYPNVDLSNTFYSKFKNLIKLKDCYNNVAHIVYNNYSLLEEYPNINIVYGGMQININNDEDNNLFVKHCYFKIENEIIDPTMSKHKSFNKQIKYFSVIEYTIPEYINMLKNSNCTFPVNIMVELNKASLDLLQYNIIYAG